MDTRAVEDAAGGGGGGGKSDSFYIKKFSIEV